LSVLRPGCSHSGIEGGQQTVKGGGGHPFLGERLGGGGDFFQQGRKRILTVKALLGHRNARTRRLVPFGAHFNMVFFKLIFY
jgi:hypothetical protein